jgi:hypothetical protein
MRLEILERLAVENQAGGALLAEPVLASLAVEHGARSLQPIAALRASRNSPG